MPRILDATNCPHCGAELEPPLPRVCPECGGSLQKRFLTSCGCLSSAPTAILLGFLAWWWWLG